MERPLAAVMFSDIVGYAGLMGESERRGLLARSQHQEIVALHCQASHRRNKYEFRVLIDLDAYDLEISTGA